MEIKAIPEIEQMMIEINENIANIDIQHKVTNNYREWDSVSFAMKVHQQIDAIRKLHANPQALQLKMGMLSKLLRSCNVDVVGIQMSFMPTTINAHQENFSWLFTLVSDTQKKNGFEDVMKSRLNEVKSLVGLFNETTKQSPFRHSNLMQQYAQIQKLFLMVDEQLKFPSDDQSIALTAMILYDLEQMSKVYFPALLICQEMYDKNNQKDQWIAYLDIAASYDKPQVSVA